MSDLEIPAREAGKPASLPRTQALLAIREEALQLFCARVIANPSPANAIDAAKIAIRYVSASTELLLTQEERAKLDARAVAKEKARQRFFTGGRRA